MVMCHCVSPSTSLSDYVQIGATLLLAAVAFLAPYWIEKWKSKYFAPKLSIKFRHTPPYCHKTVMGASRQYPVYYFRFAVVNSGRRQADDCEAILEKIWRKDGAGNFNKIEDWTPVHLKWSGPWGDDRQFYSTIYPGERKVFCDIGRIHPQNQQPLSVYRGITDEEQRTNKFFFELPLRYYSQWDCLTPGRYKIEVAVYGKNANRVNRRFNINWSGKWGDTDSKMFSELVIS